MSNHTSSISIVAERMNDSKLFGRLKTMRETDPVFFNQKNKYWEVFSYEDVKTVLSDYSTFSSKIDRGVTEEQAFGDSIIDMDPPRHNQLRTIVNKAFSPKRINSLEEHIRKIAENLLNKSDNTMDLIQDFAYPLPVIIIAQLLGIPEKDQKLFHHWIESIFKNENDRENINIQYLEEDEEHDTQMNMQMIMRNYFKKFIEEKRKEPKDDLISTMLQSDDSDEPLTEQDLLNFCFLLFIAGHLTTTHLIGNCVLALAEFPDVFNELRENNSLIPKYIEEVLRYRSPVPFVTRTVRKEIKLGNQILQPGDIVVAWIASANRDEATYEKPDTLDIERNTNLHLGFGRGIHHCLGAPLARLETKIALELLLNKISSPCKIEVSALVPEYISFLHGVKKLPIHL
ncbi:cytochrome P450 [Bacillus pseudomycoides]|nr:cytochrome P450 [Bacillus pseudomycoides]